MSKFDEFMKRPAPSRPKGQEIGGSFQCQVCFDEAEIAEYHNRERLLIWRCAEGHESFIEEFRL